MDWKIGCFTSPWASFGIDRALDGIKSAGFEYVGLGSSNEGDEFQSLGGGQDGAREIQIKLDALSLKPVILYANWTGETGVEDFKKRIDQAQLLEIGLLLTDGTPTESDPEEAASLEAQFLSRMSQILPYAEENNVKILLKSHTGNTAHGPVLRATLSKVGSRWMESCYDPGTVRFLQGLSPEVDILHVLPHLGALCATDHRGQKGEEDFPVPGQGSVDFVRILRLLKMNRFSGPVMVERLHGTQSRGEEEIDELAVQAHDFLQGAVDALNETSAG